MFKKQSKNISKMAPLGVTISLYVVDWTNVSFWIVDKWQLVYFKVLLV